MTQRQHAAWSQSASAACATLGAACLWAWGYAANLSSALFPRTGAIESIGIEFVYYASQLTLALLSIALVFALRRWRPGLPPTVVLSSAVLLSLATVAVAGLMRLGQVPLWSLVTCGMLYGVTGFVLTAAWGARFSLGSKTMRRVVLLSFLLGYGIYLVLLPAPHVMAGTVTMLLPATSGLLWLLDSWRRHLLTSEVWPSAGEGRGEVAAGILDAGILPWRTMALFAVTALAGNFVTSFVMGSSYRGAAIIFPGAFAVCACITLAAAALVGSGARRLSVERLYRYCLPLAVLGMLIVLAVPTLDPAWPGVLVAGASLFLQVLVILKVVESTQETGVSPLLSFGVGQGLVSGVVFLGNVSGRAASHAVAGESPWLAAVCAAGVFVLFYLLVLSADSMAKRLLELNGEAMPIPVGQMADAGSTMPGARERASAFARKFDLTPRETEVCVCLLQGRSLPVIAEQLSVTTGTVKTHALHIYRKTGVAGKQELISLFAEDAPASKAGADE